MWPSLRRMKMKSEESATPGLHPPSTSSARPVVIPLHGSTSMSKVYKVESRPNIMPPLRSIGKKTNFFRKFLCNPTTQKLEAAFLNGKPLTIEYMFDPKKPDHEVVLIKLDCLSPIFGGVVPTTMDRFSSISELSEFVKTVVHLNICEGGRRADCLCHPPIYNRRKFCGIKPVEDECSQQHFHHYCWEHVVSWLCNYLYLVILLRESKKLFDEEIAENYSMFPEDIPYFQTGYRATPEFLLKSALDIHAALYEGDGE